MEDNKRARKVLMVDDEAVVLEVASELMGLMGYEVLTAQTGMEALDLYREHGEAIDGVILDVMMPGMGGVKVMDALQQMNPEVRVILSSGYHGEEEFGEILDRGACGFVNKPFSFVKLKGALARFLGD